MPVEVHIDHSEHIAPPAGSDGERSVAGAQNSPQYASSASETSENRDEDAHGDLVYLSEFADADDIHPSDSASESQPRPRRRHTAGSSRSHTGPRIQARRQDRGPGYILRKTAPESLESVDSADDFVAEGAYRPDPRQRQAYHGNGHVAQTPPYAHSSSSGASYVYPPVPGPPSNQMVHFGAPPPAPYAQQFPQMGVPPPVGYPPPPNYQMSHHSGSHVGSPYGVPPYTGQQIVPFGPVSGYFPPQYPAPYPPTQPWDPYQRFHQSPPPQPPAAPAPEQRVSPIPATAPNTSHQEDIVKRVEAMFAEDRKEREARDAAREALAKEAADHAAAKAERAASDARIAEEAAAKARAASAKEAADNAAAEAKRAASDAKIAEDAAAKAREEVKREAEAKAAEEAARARAEAEATAAAAARDEKIAEETAAKVRKEIQEAAAPSERKAPIKFKDAVGRKFNFPFHLCAKWSGMEELIRQAFLHVENIGPHVQDGHYDLLGPNGDIILPQVWENVVEPDWTVTMHMWPIPEPEKHNAPPLPVGVINEGQSGKPKGKFPKKKTHLPPPPPPLLPPPPPLSPLPSVAAAAAAAAAPSVLPSGNAVNPTLPLDVPTPGGKEVDNAIKKPDPARPVPKKVVPVPSLRAWMLGRKPSKPHPKALKETKKPGGATASQQGATAGEGSLAV